MFWKEDYFGLCLHPAESSELFDHFFNQNRLLKIEIFNGRNILETIESSEIVFINIVFMIK